MVKEVVRDDELTRIVGYVPERKPPALALRQEKAAQLERALRYLSGKPTVDLEQLRSLIGNWVWAALDSEMGFDSSSLVI